jgi:hypothetical protein
MPSLGLLPLPKVVLRSSTIVKHGIAAVEVLDKKRTAYSKL